MFRKALDLAVVETSSKMSLKISCLKACDNDVDKARKLYDFLAEDITTIPDFEPVKVGTFAQIKEGAGELFGWIDTHREEVTKGLSFIQSLRKTPASPAPASSIPPIPKI